MRKKLIFILVTILLATVGVFAGCNCSGCSEDERVTYVDYNSDLGTLMQTSTSFITVKHPVFGGSHYAYTEGLYEESNNDAPEGTESNYRPGGELIYLTMQKDGDEVKLVEKILLKTEEGSIRDPDVSEDGKRVVFSMKKSKQDDYHLYEMVIATGKYRQLTFGSGVADFEPQYLASGEIIFSSSRAIQTVDCWLTPVSNLYKCQADGSNIVRLGYDQVHTTYPTTTSDGRVIYTRWDYNDRTQMYVQGIFQMNPDGTNQTEVYGNNSNFPTTLIHSREVPGTTDKYISVAIGHHTWQAGKLVMVDLSVGRNDKDAVNFVFPDQYSEKVDDIDEYGQQGPLYQYPYAINENLLLVSYSANGWGRGTKSEAPFGIYLMNTSGKKIELLSGEDGPYANIIPIKAKALFERSNMTDYSKDTGTYYVSNVYEGQAMEGIEVGTVKQIRVVALDYRPYAIGATIGVGSGVSDPYTPIATGNGSWDVKVVLGVATVYEDGSALFNVPSETPVYFQLLDEDGCVVQTMRSWSTLMPGESYSCVGCHEDKNTAPTASTQFTIAMTMGIEDLVGDAWQEGTTLEERKQTGFDYLEEVQPIFDNNCISCHNNKLETYNAIGLAKVDNSGVDMPHLEVATKIFDLQENWQYKTQTTAISDSTWKEVDYNSSTWTIGQAGFGDRDADGAKVNTPWNDDNVYMYMRKEFTISDLSVFNGKNLVLNTWYDDGISVYINGNLVFSNVGWTNDYSDIVLKTNANDYLVAGKNVIAISLHQTGGGRFIDLSLRYIQLKGEIKETIDNPFSLEAESIYSERMKKYFPLSYLLLTDSEPRHDKNKWQWLGNSDNDYINWLSSMSVPEIIQPDTFGSSKSNLIDILRTGHHGVVLSDADIRTICAWIDLCVPCYGEYDTNNAWTGYEKREAEEEQNKRDYYDMLNDYARMAIAGTLPEGTINVEFKNNGKTYTASGEGIVNLYAECKYTDGATIKVTLPDGNKYIGFTINAKLGESIIYCPDGTFTFTITQGYLDHIFPEGASSKAMAQPNNTITVRIPTVKELQTVRNIAENAYDLQDAMNAYPHASSDSEWENYEDDPMFLARNAIDGFSVNTGHGSYPNQSWGPDMEAGHYIKIDFGREVTVEKIGVFIRYDAMHDTYFESGNVKLSDGSTIGFTLEFVKGEQFIVFDSPLVTTSITLENLVTEKRGWAGISELKVYGYDNIS